MRDELTDRFGAAAGAGGQPAAAPGPAPQGVGELGATAVAFRGGRLQVEGLKLDDGWAARVRAAQPRVAYFKQRAALVAHAAEGDPELLAWAQAIVAAVVSCRDPLATGGDGNGR